MAPFRSALAGLAAATALGGGAAAEPLRLDVYTAPARGYGVTSTVIYGPTEAILVDAQFGPDDAAAVADRIEALGKRLKAIVLTHPDADHFLGLPVLQKRFPAAPTYITAAGLPVYAAKLPGLRADERLKRPDRAPPPEPLARALPTTHLTVDGQRVEVIADLQGDVHEAATNSIVWVPSLKAVIVGDLAFDRVHPWLDQSTAAGRAAWVKALDRVDAMKPAIVVAGHKRNGAAADTPQSLAETRRYILAFDAQLKGAADRKALAGAMKASFADWSYPLFIDMAAASASPT